MQLLDPWIKDYKAGVIVYTNILNVTSNFILLILEVGFYMT